MGALLMTHRRLWCLQFPLADEADALAAEALFDGEDISQRRLGRYFVVVGRGGPSQDV